MPKTEPKTAMLLQIPHLIVKSHTPSIVPLQYHKAHHDVPPPRRDAVAPVQKRAGVRHDLPLIDPHGIIQRLEPRPTSLVVGGRVQRYVERQDRPVPVRLQFRLAAIGIVLDDEPVRDAKVLPAVGEEFSELRPQQRVYPLDERQPEEIQRLRELDEGQVGGGVIPVTRSRPPHVLRLPLRLVDHHLTFHSGEYRSGFVNQVAILVRYERRVVDVLSVGSLAEYRVALLRVPPASSSSSSAIVGVDKR